MIFVYLAICFLILLSRIILSSSFFTKCASLFLCIGLPLKFIIFLLGSPLGGESAEPIGLFIPSEKSLNEVILVIAVGVVSFSLTSYVMDIVFQSKTFTPPPQRHPYQVTPRMAAIYTFSITVAALVNYKYRLNIVGLNLTALTGITYLFWNWLINHGFFLIATFLMLQRIDCPPQKKKVYLIFTLAIGFLLATFRLSRGYIFYSIPIVFVFFTTDHFSKIRKHNLTDSLIIFFFFSIFLVSNVFLTGYLRDQIFIQYISPASPSPSPLASARSIVFHDRSNDKENQLKASTNLLLTDRVIKLIVNRWVGLEGVMSVQAYRNKSTSSLLKAFDPPTKNNLSFYDDEIAHSKYLLTNNNTVKFATLPGPVGFFYISGQLWVVAIAMMALTFLCGLLEAFARKLTPENPYALAYFSCFLALSFAQFGFRPLHIIAHILSFILFFLISFFVSKRLDKFRLPQKGRYLS